MASITIRNLDDDLKRSLRIRAAKHGRSMEDEVRDILRAALAAPDSDGPDDLASVIARRFAKSGPIDLQLPERDPIRPLGDLK